MNKTFICKKCGTDLEERKYSESENLCQECFIKDHIPTKTENLNWIYVRNQIINSQDEGFESEDDFLEFISNMHRIKRISNEIHIKDKDGSIKIKPLNLENVDQLARDMKITVGKWMIFESPQSIDESWMKIVNAIIQSKIIASAKVSTAISKQKDYVICIYTDNYFNETEVMKVRNQLKELGFNRILYYKPDIYTYLGIYSGTCNMPAYRYKA
ncbi:MAG: DUF1917 domain-containing protein [Candidatus Heimdallarchaeota archaeon]